MDRQQYYDMFPERGYGNDRAGGGFGRFLSIAAFKFDLWLKGDPVRQCRNIFRRDEDDDFTVSNARIKFQPRPTRGDAGGSVSRTKKDLSRSTIILKSPSTPKLVKVATTATAVVKVLHAKRNTAQPEWKQGWAEWVMMQTEVHKDEAGTTVTPPDTAPTVQEALPCAKKVDEARATLELVLEKDDGVDKEDEEREDTATPPVTPPTSSPSSTCGTDVSWPRSCGANHQAVPWDATLYYF